MDFILFLIQFVILIRLSLDLIIKVTDFFFYIRDKFF